MKIKGIFLKDYVQIVKDTPDLDWKSWLTAEDWEIVNGMVYATTWYPVETMGRIGRGIFEMRSNRNYEVVRMHGRARATESFDEITSNCFSKTIPRPLSGPIPGSSVVMWTSSRSSSSIPGRAGPG